MRRPIQTLVLALLALGAAALTPAAAATGGLTVELYGSRRITLAGVASSVVVGDPMVADVALTDAHSIVLVGKGYGATQLIVTDRAGHTLLDGTVTVVSPDAGRVTVYRGVSATEFACAGLRCHPSVHATSSTENSTSGGDASAAAPAPPSHP